MPLDVDRLAQQIRYVNGGNKMGAGALAELLIPFIESELRAETGNTGSASGDALLSAARAVVQADDAQVLTPQLISALRSAINEVDIARAATPDER